jgi:hypothetical protein
MPAVAAGGPVVAVAFGADGKAIVATRKDDDVALWALPPGKPLGPPLAVPHLTYVALAPGGRELILLGKEMTLRVPVPTPVEGSAERIALWAQVLTGMELDERGAPRVFDAAAWQQRRERLHELGGPPGS